MDGQDRFRGLQFKKITKNIKIFKMPPKLKILHTAFLKFFQAEQHPIIGNTRQP